MHNALLPVTFADVTLATKVETSLFFAVGWRHALAPRNAVKLLHGFARFPAIIDEEEDRVFQPELHTNSLPHTSQSPDVLTSFADSFTMFPLWNLCRADSTGDKSEVTVIGLSLSQISCKQLSANTHHSAIHSWHEPNYNFNNISLFCITANDY